MAVTLITTAAAPAGMPHCPAKTNVRLAPAASAGAPYGPAGPRVSKTRQGVSVKKLKPGVVVRVGVGVNVGVTVCVRVNVGVTVGVRVNVGVIVGVKVRVNVGVNVDVMIG